MDNETLLKTCIERAEKWLAPQYDEETRTAVKALLDNPDHTELIDSFYKDLEFGTGGLRGIMGAGTNRMNIYTVGAATQGLANYLKECFKDLPQISVAVGHDVRNNSRKFAEMVAAIFSANGIKVYLFDDCRPTPEVSYAIRHLGCQSGVNITASHNPKEYNGYKAYWSDGAQMIAPHDVETIAYVNAITSVDQIKFEANPELIQIIGKDVDEPYLEEILGLSLSPESDRRHADMKIVYTPIHGVGSMLIYDSLSRWGFKNVIHVPEQDVKDGNFPTVISPNPENAEAMSMAIAKAKETGASIVLASDPDSDRIGVVVRDKDAVSAVSMMCEIAAWAADKDMNLYELLIEIYAKYGFSRERGVSVVRPGKSGADEIVAMMKNFRENPPKELAGSPVVTVKDYADLNCTDIRTGSVEKMNFPTTSNVLQFFTEAGDKISIRPSGTEPKIKFYIEVREQMASKEAYEATVKEADRHIDRVLADLGVK